MIAPARLAASDALRAIDDGPIDLGEAIAKARLTLHDERDHALLLEIVTGTLRMRSALDYQIGLRSNRAVARLDAAVLRVLRLSAFQLLYLSRMPPAAVINDAVEMTRKAGKSSAAGMVNAILRRLAREREALQWPDDMAIVHSHPRWLVDRWIARHGRDNTEQWLQFNNRPPSLCLAVNRTITTRESLIRELAAAGVSTEPTARAAEGLHVVDGHPLRLEAFNEGKFIVQDEASQLIAELVEVGPGARVLDLCASPGGKTLALSARVGSAGEVVACDVRPHRVRLLQRTVTRCRLTNTRVVHIGSHGPVPFRDAAFDAVLIDAPCSGLGTVRRDPDIKWRRHEDDLPRFAQSQLALLQRAAPLVGPGGIMVYSTCSSEPEENRHVVEAFLRSGARFNVERTHETLPYRDNLEAFFGAVLRRE
jgi:16S rRNA (cytosine967-C5)-methyltransferase